MKKRLLALVISLSMILPTSSFALEGGYGADWGEQVIYPSIVLYSSTDKYEKWTDPYYLQGEYDSRGSYFYVSEFITMMHEFGQLDWKVSYEPKTKVVTISNDDSIVKYTIGKYDVIHHNKALNKKYKYLYTKEYSGRNIYPIINEGRVMLPFSYLGSLGFYTLYEPQQFELRLANYYDYFALEGALHDMQVEYSNRPSNGMDGYLPFDPYIDLLDTTGAELWVDPVPKKTNEMSYEDMINQSQIDQGGGVG